MVKVVRKYEQALFYRRDFPCSQAGKLCLKYFIVIAFLNVIFYQRNVPNGRSERINHVRKFKSDCTGSNELIFYLPSGDLVGKNA